jgi:hypothetical protein
VRDIEKALETAIIFIEAAEKRVNALERRVNDAFYNNKNNDEDFKDFEDFTKIIRAEIKTTI